MRELRRILSVVAAVLLSVSVQAQYNYPTGASSDSLESYRAASTHQVAEYKNNFKSRKPKNVILMIGDGMGLNHVYAGMTANGGRLNLNNFYVTGFSCTYSANNYITDSGAGGSAIATGQKSKNSRIGMNANDQPAKTILEYAEEKGLATGLVSTSTITHATPASFIAHQKSRNSYEDIAADFLKTDIDVFIGGGYNHFAQREDGADLTKKLEENNYQFVRDLESVKNARSGKLAALLAPKDMPRVSGRGDMLPVATENAIRLLSQNKKGFFIMIEGSQIDWGAHANNMQFTMEEMLDFDQAIGEALEFASKDGNTLVVVTADHETGGLSLTGGNIKENYIKGTFSSKGHTAAMVPVFAFGPGAEKFAGIMENTELHNRIYKLLIEGKK